MIDLDFLEQTSNKLGSKGGGKYKRTATTLQIPAGAEIKVAIIPPIEIDSEGKAKIFGLDGRNLICQYSAHKGTVNGKTQTVPDITTIDPTQDCLVKKAIESGVANIKDYKYRQCYAMRAVLLNDNNEKISLPDGKPKVDKDGKQCVGYTMKKGHGLKIIDCGKMLADEYIKSVLSYVRNLLDLGEQPDFKLSELPVYIIKRTGTGFDTKYTVIMLPRKAFVFPEIFDLKKDDGTFYFDGSNLKERMKSCYEYLAKPASSEVFMPQEQATQAFIRGEDMKPYFKKRNSDNGSDFVDPKNLPF